MRSHKDSVLTLLGNIAQAESEEKYEGAVATLKGHVLWQSDYSAKFRRWLDKTWLPAYKVSSYFKYIVRDFLDGAF